MNRHMAFKKAEFELNKDQIVDLAIIVILVAYVSLTIAALWDTPYVLTFVLLPPPIILALRLKNRHALVVGLTSAVIGPLTEVFCVMGGLWSYSNTGGLPLIPPWLFLAWANFSLAIWMMFRIFLNAPFLASNPSRRLLMMLLCGIGIEIVVFVSLGESTLLALIAALAMIAILLATTKGWPIVIMMSTGLFLGPICESLPIAAGAWHYAQPQFMGMPIWMPLAYAVFGALVGRASQVASALALGKGKK